MTAASSAEKRLVAAGFVWFALMGMAVTMTGPLSATAGGLFQQPKANESQIGTALFAGSALIVALNGAFSTFFSGRWVARFCGVAYVLGITCAWVAPSWGILLAGYALIGMGNGGNSIWYNAEFARHFRDKKVGAWLSALNGFWAVGAVTGPVVVGNFAGDPRMSLAILAGLAWVALPLAWWVAAPPAQAAVDEGKVVVPRQIWGLMAALGLYVGAETTTLTFMSRHLMTVHQITLEDAAKVASVLWFAFMLSRFGSGPIAARHHPSRIVIGCATLAVASVSLSTHPGMAWVAYPLLGAAMGPVFPAVIAWGTGLSPAPHRMTSLMVLGPCVTAVSFPAAVAFSLGERYHSMPWIVVGLHVFIAAIALAVMPKASRPV